MTTTAAPVVNAATDHATGTPLGGILRDITRGGFTGIIVGLVGCGIGSRIVMRLAALIVPESAGAFTQNGNPIGEISLGGSLSLASIGLVAGVIASTIWIVVSPWIPSVGIRRAVLAMPIAVAIGTTALIAGDSQDFFVLRHDPTVVGLLIVLVAVIGFLFALVDDALDRWLPVASGPVAIVYAFVATIWVALMLLSAVVSFLTASLMGVALVGVGMATLGLWVVRVKGRPRSIWLIIAGRATLAVAVVLGFARTVPEVSLALGIT